METAGDARRAGVGMGGGQDMGLPQRHVGLLHPVPREWPTTAVEPDCWVQLAFGLLVGVFMSPPLRTGINSLSKYVAQRFEGRSASPGEADEVRAACREVKVTKYSWEDDGTYIKVGTRISCDGHRNGVVQISVPVDKGDIADITDKGNAVHSNGHPEMFTQTSRLLSHHCLLNYE